MWSGFTFLFMAYTGTDVMEVAGLTICKATFIMIDQTLTEEDTQIWCNVRVLIIDEISFMKDSELKKNLTTGSKRLKSVSKSLEGIQLSSQETFVNLSQ